jgi:hypothetical protein
MNLNLVERQFLLVFDNILAIPSALSDCKIRIREQSNIRR